ncbi:MAG: hypothetical protein ABSF44_13765 [Candidatus Bathyarchaeia archaeon]|jgi:hypothetical protein
MKRAEAIALLKELEAEHLLQPTAVLIEQRKPDNFQLKIKGNYDCEQIEIFLNKRFSLEEHNGLLIIYKP